jgi:hypothetical protein
MKSSLLVLLVILFFEPIPIQGKWQLTSFEAFEKTLESKLFLAETEEKQKLMLETFDFVLANTFYEFKEETLYILPMQGVAG